MGKKISFILSLLLGICCFGVTSFAADEQVELWIHTRAQDGTKVEGTDQLELDVYDLTDWREKQRGDEKGDKEFIVDTYTTREKLKSFVEQEQLTKCNQELLKVDGSGNVSFDVARYSGGKDAAYLILASGETGNYHMSPIIIYLPQKHPETNEEAQRLLIYAKYKDMTPIPSPSIDSTSKTEETSKERQLSALGPQSTGSKKEYPSTNDLIRNYTFLGIILIMIGFIGYKLTNKRKKIGGKKL
ncbi:hypothetical protein [Enterococcus malodoratus]|uniref:hypothetical protein n=1 Tax=Enterococcus malodoratus TaxID=71451 RepID=UPI0039AF3581